MQFATKNILPDIFFAIDNLIFFYLLLLYLILRYNFILRALFQFVFKIKMSILRLQTAVLVLLVF